jgi:hypothetical protein
MIKHTFRPWTVREDKQRGITSENRFVIECDTNVPGIKGTVGRVSYKPYACLIAAAPKLLEACKDVLEIEDTLSGSAKDVLSRAIAKAEGL